MEHGSRSTPPRSIRAAEGSPPIAETVGGILVSEVEERAGAVWHRVDRPPQGDPAPASIDWPRRFDHMQQHTGQHILSAAFVEVARAETRSFHLGEGVVTIDVDHADPDEALVRAVEARANEIVWEDREVLTHVVPLEEARRLPLRKPPTVEGDVRVVEVRGFDWSACGGTHVSRTGEVGVIAILGRSATRGVPGSPSSPEGGRFAASGKPETCCGARASNSRRESRISCGPSGV
jgi:alanyl-tRNA synthetase